MHADGFCGAVRECLLQGLVYCMDTEYAHLGFPTNEEGGFFERPFKCPPLCDDTLVIQGLVHASVVLPSTNCGLETSLAPWKFALDGGAVQRRLSSKGSCWNRMVCGSSAALIRGLVIERRASFQDGLIIFLYFRSRWIQIGDCLKPILFLPSHNTSGRPKMIIFVVRKCTFLWVLYPNLGTWRQQHCFLPSKAYNITWKSNYIPR